LDSFIDMKGKGFSYVMAVAMAALLIVAGKTVYDYRTDPVKGTVADAKTEEKGPPRGTALGSGGMEE
jgi:hypothetical protein